MHLLDWNESNRLLLHRIPQVCLPGAVCCACIARGTTHAMDGSTFDRLTRAVIAGRTRRQVLTIIAGLGLSGLLGSADHDAAAKRRHRRRSGKRKRSQDNGSDGGGSSNTPASCSASGGSCPSGQTCTPNGTCQIKSSCGPLTCDGCCDAQGVCQRGDDIAVCGWFGLSCVACQGSATTCRFGQCLCTPRCGGRTCGDDGCGNPCGRCREKETCCDGHCVDLDKNTDHCGACDHMCPALADTCREGDCCVSGLGPEHSCTADAPCCSPLVCSGTGGGGDYCCLPAGLQCSTDHPELCCHGCQKIDPSCTGTCLGACA